MGWGWGVSGSGGGFVCFGGVLCVCVYVSLSLAQDYSLTPTLLKSVEQMNVCELQFTPFGTMQLTKPLTATSETFPYKGIQPWGGSRDWLFLVNTQKHSLLGLFLA